MGRLSIVEDRCWQQQTELQRIADSESKREVGGSSDRFDATQSTRSTCSNVTCDHCTSDVWDACSPEGNHPETLEARVAACESAGLDLRRWSAEKSAELAHCVQTAMRDVRHNLDSVLEEISELNRCHESAPNSEEIMHLSGEAPPEAWRKALKSWRESLEARVDEQREVTAALQDNVFALRDDLTSVQCARRGSCHVGFHEKFARDGEACGASVEKEQTQHALGTILEVSSNASDQVQDQLDRLCFLEPQVMAIDERMGAVEACLQTRLDGVEVVVHTLEDQLRSLAAQLRDAIVTLPSFPAQAVGLEDEVPQHWSTDFACAVPPQAGVACNALDDFHFTLSTEHVGDSDELEDTKMLKALTDVSAAFTRIRAGLEQVGPRPPSPLVEPSCLAGRSGRQVGDVAAGVPPCLRIDECAQKIEFDACGLGAVVRQPGDDERRRCASASAVEHSFRQHGE